MFISGQNYNFSDLAREIQKFGRQNIGAAEFLRRFEQSGVAFEAAQKVYVESTRGQNTLFFTGMDGSKIPIYTPTTFEQGSSLSHITTSVETLMFPFLRRGTTLEDLINRVGGSNIYGKDIQNILETIGWPTPANEIPKYAELALGFDGEIPVPKPTSSSTGGKHFGILLLIIILLF